MEHTESGHSEVRSFQHLLCTLDKAGNRGLRSDEYRNCTSSHKAFYKELCDLDHQDGTCEDRCDHREAGTYTPLCSHNRE